MPRIHELRWAAALGAALLGVALGAPSRAAEAGRVYFAGSPHSMADCGAPAQDPSTAAASDAWAHDHRGRAYRALARHPVAVGFGSPGACAGYAPGLPLWLYLHRPEVPGGILQLPLGNTWGG